MPTQRLSITSEGGILRQSRDGGMVRVGAVFVRTCGGDPTVSGMELEEWRAIAEKKIRDLNRHVADLEKDNRALKQTVDHLVYRVTKLGG